MAGSTTTECPLADVLAQRRRDERRELTARRLERIAARVAVDPNRIFPSNDLLDHVLTIADLPLTAASLGHFGCFAKREQLTIGHRLPTRWDWSKPACLTPGIERKPSALERGAERGPAVRCGRVHREDGPPEAVSVRHFARCRCLRTFRAVARLHGSETAPDRHSLLRGVVRDRKHFFDANELSRVGRIDVCATRFVQRRLQLALRSFER